jgi:hypothetical protein
MPVLNVCATVSFPPCTCGRSTSTSTRPIFDDCFVDVAVNGGDAVPLGFPELGGDDGADELVLPGADDEVVLLVSVEPPLPGPVEPGSTGVAPGSTLDDAPGGTGAGAADVELFFVVR